MTGNGPFLWLSEKGSPQGFHRLPPGGLCLSAFLFVERDGRILLGKYADDARWETLAGLDPTRRAAHRHGWTIPASHLRYGEDPREAARRIAADILGLPGISLGEPRVETEFEEPARFPGMGRHQDFWFFFDAKLPATTRLATPPWYDALELHDPRALPKDAYGRSHGDIVERWLAKRSG